jgi:hypothetical protein
MLANKALSAAPSAVPVYVEDVFSSYLYTGTGASQTITNNIDLSTKGGLVWIKGRNQATGHWLTDTARGVTKALQTNSTIAEQTKTAGVTAFSTSGFSIGDDGDFSDSAGRYISWTFAQQEKFFDVVTYTGNGSGNRTLNHSLASTPGCIIIKATSVTDDWYVYHRSLGTNKFLYLNGTNSEQSLSIVTAVSSTDFTVSLTNGFNTNGRTYVAYLFAHDAGGFGASGSDNVITCGSYTGNGSATGPTITLGYEPQWILIKNTSSAQNWYLLDNMRGMPVGSADANLIPNLSNAESDSTVLSPTATGFQLDTAGSPNNNGDTFIYIAIRRGPMKTPTSGTSVFYPKVHSGSSSYSVGFPTDTCFAADQSGNALNTVVVYRLAGDNKYFGGTASTAAEQTVSVCQFDLQNSFQLSYNNNNQARWHFGRAPGFFDVVCYTGTGSAGLSVSHNLGVVPELIIVKRRDASVNWAVGTQFGASDFTFAFLNTTGAGFVNQGYNTSYGFYAKPTTSAFTLDTASSVNSSTGTYVAYLFASLTGVSKVGSYTGNGSSQTINCGFTGGARLVLIKRTDSTGDWVTFDTARGIVSGNDPALYLNSTAAEVTGVDGIDPDNSGFVVNQETTFNLNVNNATYIFYAVA